MTTRQKHDIEWAEEVLGRNVTEFSVQALTERASEVLTDRHVVGVAQPQWGQFVGQLEQPAPRVKELIALLRRPSVLDE